MSNIKRSIGEIISQIEKIRKLDLKQVDYSEVYYEIRELMNEYVAVQFPASNNEIFRVRLNEKDEFGQFIPFRQVKDLWAPKPEDMPFNKFGRANRPNNPVFYCSNSEETAISEALIQEGSWITIMHCISKCDLSLMKTVGIGFRDDLVFKSKDGKISLKWEEHKKEKIGRRYITNYDGYEESEGYIKNKLIDHFLNEEFRKRISDDECDFEYKTTVAIASLYLDLNPPSISLDGIAYPSIKGSESSPNWVFTVDAVNKFFRPDYFETYEIGRIEQNENRKTYGLNLKFRSEDIGENGEIEWKKERTSPLMGDRF